MEAKFIEKRPPLVTAFSQTQWSSFRKIYQTEEFFTFTKAGQGPDSDFLVVFCFNPDAIPIRLKSYYNAWRYKKNKGKKMKNLYESCSEKAQRQMVPINSRINVI